jgi:polygalacturonase
MFEELKKARLIGRGSIDGNGIEFGRETAVPGGGPSILRSNMADECIVQGVILQNPCMFPVFLRKSYDWSLYNVKLIDYHDVDLGANSGKDGIEIDDCREIDVDNVFVSSGDACCSIESVGLVPRNYKMSNIFFRNSVIANYATGIALSLGSSLGTIQVGDVTFENIDIVDAFIGSFQGSRRQEHYTEIMDLYYKNLRFENLRRAFQVMVAFNGPIKNINYHNIILSDWGPESSSIEGADTKRIVKKVTFENLIVGGQPQSDASNFRVNPFVEDLEFHSVPPNVVSIVTVEHAAESGPAPGVFTVSRSGDLSQKLTIKLAIRGTATNGEDYNHIHDSVTIPANSETANITITPVTDNEREGIETVFISLLNKLNSTDFVVGPDYHAVLVLADSK